MWCVFQNIAFLFQNVVSVSECRLLFGIAVAAVCHHMGSMQKVQATGPHRARVDMTPPTGGPVGHAYRYLVDLCDTQRAGKEIVKRNN